MRREDLFAAIGEVEESRLAMCEKVMNPSVIVYWEDPKMYGKTSVRKIWLIAAVVALMLLLMGSAIAALVKMDVETTKAIMPYQEIVDGETVIVDKVVEGEKVSFEEVHDEFIELEAYYPQWIPEGYEMTFVSNDAPMQNRVIHFENSTGGLIKYWLYLGDPASYIEIYEIEEKMDVEVNGLPGILYRQSGNTQTLVWADEGKGFGFALRGNDPGVDLLAMAKSTALGDELTPTHSAETLQALEELGDFSPLNLPAGFEELDVQGWPKGDDWYSYVRKWYVNKKENTQIYFEYESYRIVTEDGYTDDARTICSFFIPGYHILKNEVVGEEIEVCGMFGIMTDNHIAWADPQRKVVYHMYSETVTGEALLEVAQSVNRMQ